MTLTWTLILLMAALLALAYVDDAIFRTRPQAVAVYFRKVLNAIDDACQSEIDVMRGLVNDAEAFKVASEKYNAAQDARWIAYERVDYDSVVNRFWRPLDSFFTELAPLLPNGLPKVGEK